MSYPSFDVDKKYTVMQNIGKGSAGSVFMCKSKRDHKTYALKQIFLDKRKKSRGKDIVLREVQILQKLDHPHIVHYHEAFFDRKQDNLFIIQDYCARGSLHEKVKTSRQKSVLIPERQIMEWYVQITMALRYIHGKRVLHRDLKTQNVFLTKANMIKIGDFGIARVLEHTVDMASTCVGTPCYLSPEICQDKPYNSKSDVWALGCLLYELCALKPAFNASNLVSLCYKIVKGSYDDIPPMYSNLVKMLIEKSLQKSPESRPTATAILNLPEVKEQLSVYITDKETERQSAHPAKRGQMGMNNNNKNRRVTARPSVVNIGANNQKRVTKKPKKSTGNANSKVTKKKKKKTKVEVQEAEDVKKLPDEIIPSSRPDSTSVAPGRLQDPFKPSEDLPPILKHNALIGYSPPTIRREDPPPQASPRSFLNQDKKVFITEYSTQTSDNRHATPGSPNNPPKFRPPISISRDISPPRDVTPRDVTPQFIDDSKPKSEQSLSPSSQNTVIPIEEQLNKREAPSFAPKSTSPVFSSTSNAIDSRTYAKPPSTPLYRIPKANKSRTSDQSKNIENRTQDPDISKCSIPEENVEVDGSELDTSRTVEVPIAITSPLNTDSVLTRETGEGNITPLPDLTYQLPVSAPKDGSGDLPDRFPEVAEKWGFGIPQAGNTIDIGMSGTGTLTAPFKAIQDQQELLPGQVQVGWSVAGPGETHGFIPEEIEGTLEKHDQEISSNVGRPDPGTIQFSVNTNDSREDDNLNLNLDDVPDNQFPNLPEKSDDTVTEAEDDHCEDDEYEYSDDFEEYEEIPDFENVEDIPDITTPGTAQEENEADSDEEDDEVFEMAMKSAKVALDNIEEEEDEEFVEDYVIPSSAGNIAALRQFCVNTLGPALFKDVQVMCQEFEDNYDSHDTFVKNLEKIAGPDKLEICLIVDEFFADE